MKKFRIGVRYAGDCGHVFVLAKNKKEAIKKAYEKEVDDYDNDFSGDEDVYVDEEDIEEIFKV